MYDILKVNSSYLKNLKNLYLSFLYFPITVYSNKLA